MSTNIKIGKGIKELASAVEREYGSFETWLYKPLQDIITATLMLAVLGGLLLLRIPFITALVALPIAWLGVVWILSTALLIFMVTVICFKEVRKGLLSVFRKVRRNG